MQTEITHGPGYAAAKVNLNEGESFTAEAGTMIAMSGGMDIETTTHKKSSGGIWKAAKRLVAGESFFLNHYTSRQQDAHVWLAATLPGDILVHSLEENDNLVVQGGSFLASESGIEVDLGWQGMKSLFSGEGLFWLHITGRGKVLLNSFGAIYPVDVDGEYVVDTGHIVAFEDTLDFSLSKAGSSWIGSFLGGEGLVCRFKGKGRLWCQSHNPPSFGRILGPMLKPR